MKNIPLLIAFFLMSSCAPVHDTTGALNLTEFKPSVDASVGCEGIGPLVSDIQIDAQANLLSVVSNSRKIPGLYMNSIASREFEFIDDSIYTLSGEWRKPEGAENQQIDINLQLVQDHVEYHAEILWELNPFKVGELKYQDVWTRGQDLEKPIVFFSLNDDNNWHGFELIAQYTSTPKNRVIKSVRVDNQKFDIDLEMGTLPKAWEKSFFVLLETTNRYTNCNTLYNFSGKSQWRNVTLKRVNIP